MQHDQPDHNDHLLNTDNIYKFLKNAHITNSRQTVLKWLREGDIPATMLNQKDGYRARLDDVWHFADKKLKKLTTTQVFEACQKAGLTNNKTTVKNWLREGVIPSTMPNKNKGYMVNKKDLDEFLEKKANEQKNDEKKRAKHSEEYWKGYSAGFMRGKRTREEELRMWELQGKRYHELITQDQTADLDNNRQTFFFLIAGDDELTSKVKYLYDFNTRTIKFNALNKDHFSRCAEGLLKFVFSLLGKKHDDIKEILDTLPGNYIKLALRTADFYYGTFEYSSNEQYM